MGEEQKAATGCPSPERLAAFHQQQIAPSEWDGVANHVARCVPCQMAISDLGTHVDRPAATELSQAASETGPLGQRARPADDATLAMPATIALPGSVPVWSSSIGSSTARGLGKLGQYELLSVLGRGNMATVYRALHSNLKKEVAIKLLPEQKNEDPAAVGRFKREMEVVGQLDHPNIVRATDAGQMDNSYYLVMELVIGEDVAKLATRVGKLSICDACEIVRQAAMGLEHARNHGLVHRDIKPSNLMLTAQGTVKILDMGLARFHGAQRSDDSLTSTGLIMGTADYMAPEQASDTHTVDIRADLYSLGCTLYHLLVGRPPFALPEFNTSIKRINAHRRVTIPPIRELLPDIPSSLEKTVDKLLSKDPAARHATPVELAKALQPYCKGSQLRRLLAGSACAVDSAYGTADSFDESSATESVSEWSHGMQGFLLLAVLALAGIGLAYIVISHW